MKEGWRYEKLDDLGTIVTGATPSTNDESNYFPKEYCFVKPSDLPLTVLVVFTKQRIMFHLKGYQFLVHYLQEVF